MESGVVRGEEGERDGRMDERIYACLFKSTYE
jgi:hypothetical protein